MLIILSTSFPEFAGIGQIQPYIDPSSGTMLLQILLAGILASLFAIKMFWVNLIGRISKLLSKIGFKKK
jgi:hypothetical protein